jgi:hypothetical protein
MKLKKRRSRRRRRRDSVARRSSLSRSSKPNQAAAASAAAASVAANGANRLRPPRSSPHQRTFSYENTSIGGLRPRNLSFGSVDSEQEEHHHARDEKKMLTTDKVRRRIGCCSSWCTTAWYTTARNVQRMHCFGCGRRQHLLSTLVSYCHSGRSFVLYTMHPYDRTIWSQVKNYHWLALTSLGLIPIVSCFSIVFVLYQYI